MVDRFVSVGDDFNLPAAVLGPLNANINGKVDASWRDGIYTDFANMPDGAFTTAETGQAVTTFGNAPSVILDGKLVHTPLAGGASANYTQIDAGAGRRVKSISALVSWPAASIGAIALVLPNQAWTNTSKLDGNVHFVGYGNGIWHCSRYSDGAGEVKYINTADTANPAPRFPDVRDGQPRLLHIELDHTTGEAMFTLPGGQVAKVKSDYISGHTGRWAIWEHFENNGTTDTPVRVHGIAVETEDVPVGTKELTRGEVARQIATSGAIPNPVVFAKSVEYIPAGTVNITVPVTTATLVAAGLEVSFIVPPSGKFRVDLSGPLLNTAASTVYWQVVEGVSTVLGQRRVRDLAEPVSSTPGAATLVFTGSPPGQARTLKWFHVQGGATSVTTSTVGSAVQRSMNMTVTPLG